jgi:Coenzyme PQQ synthesis protein D (PqqD)
MTGRDADPDGADTTGLAVLPARHEATEVAEFETELVVFEVRSGQVHLLGPLASLVFDSCDGTTTIESLVQEIGAWSDDDAATIAAAVGATLTDLTRLGLLAGTEAAVAPPCVGCGRTSVMPERDRRQWPWARGRATTSSHRH